MPRPCCIPFLVAATAVTPAVAQYETDFEAVTATATGTVLTGQDAYYIPAGTTSIDYLAYTYAGNNLSVPQNVLGGTNFIAVAGPGSPTFGRAQRDLTYGNGTGVWTIAVDTLVQFNGTLPTAQNIGSLSLQPFPGSQSLIVLNRWTDTATAATWDADYVWFDAAGAQLTEAVADPGFQNLTVNHWYRRETDINLTTNEVLEVRVTDLTTFNTVTHQPVGRYLDGGTLGTTLTPTGVRFFSGGGVAGNVSAYDNLSLAPRGTYETFGAGCPGSNGTPALAAAPTSRPTLGGMFSVDITSMPTAGGFALMVLGFDDTMWAGMPLPLSLNSFGLPGCSLLTDPADNFLVINTAGSGTWTTSIPSSTSFFGFNFFNQAFVFDPGINPQGLSTTNGAAGQLGR